MTVLFDELLPQEAATRENTSLGPEGSFFDNAAAQWWADDTGQRATSADRAWEQARAERRAMIEKTTGKSFTDAAAPYRPTLMMRFNRRDDTPFDVYGGADQADIEDLAADLIVTDLRKQGTAPGLLTTQELKARSYELAQDNEINAADMEARSPGLSGMVARFVGSGGNAMTDPVLAALLPFGAAAGTGMAATLAIEGGLGAAGSAATLPFVAKWRKEAGLEDMTAGDAMARVATDAVTQAATAGLLKGAGHLISKLVTPRAAVEAFDRAFPNREDVPQELTRARDTLETVADITEANPLADTPAGEAEHFKRLADTMDAMSAGEPPPKMPEDNRPPPSPLPPQYQQLDPADIQTDAQRFQYKEGGDAQGVTARLKGVKTWDPIKGNAVIVWEARGGQRFIADGHQRLGLAKRLKAEGQDPKMLAIVLKEADGVSAADARVIAAMRNIEDGSGTAIDAAKVLRTRPELASELSAQGPLTPTAKALVNLSDDAFRKVVNEVVPPNYAALVGRLAADRPDIHGQLIDVLAKNEPASVIEAESMIRDAMDAPQVQATMEDLFGTATQTQVLYRERAGVLSQAAKIIKKDKAAFAVLVREQSRIEQAGNVLAGDVNAARLADDERLLEQLQRLARRAGPVADALASAAKSVHEGTARTVAAQRFLEDVRTAAQSERGLGSDAGAGVAQPADAGVAPPADRPGADDMADMFAPPPSPAETRMQVETVPEPDANGADFLSELADMDAEMQARFDRGEISDEMVANATDGQYGSAKDLFDDLKADAEFLDAVKVCLQ